MPPLTTYIFIDQSSLCEEIHIKAYDLKGAYKKLNKMVCDPVSFKLKE